MISSSLQVPMPVSLSGVMFGAVTLNGGSSKRKTAGVILAGGRRGGPFGEWQLPQVMMVLTR